MDPPTTFMIESEDLEIEGFAVIQDRKMNYMNVQDPPSNSALVVDDEEELVGMKQVSNPPIEELEYLSVSTTRSALSVNMHDVDAAASVTLNDEVATVASSFSIKVSDHVVKVETVQDEDCEDDISTLVSDGGLPFPTTHSLSLSVPITPSKFIPSEIQSNFTTKHSLAVDTETLTPTKSARLVPIVSPLHASSSTVKQHFDPLQLHRLSETNPASQCDLKVDAATKEGEDVVPASMNRRILLLIVVLMVGTITSVMMTLPGMLAGILSPPELTEGSNIAESAERDGLIALPEKGAFNFQDEPMIHTSTVLLDDDLINDSPAETEEAFMYCTIWNPENGICSLQDKFVNGSTSVIKDDLTDDTPLSLLKEVTVNDANHDKQELHPESPPESEIISSRKRYECYILYFVALFIASYKYLVPKKESKVKKESPELSMKYISSVKRSFEAFQANMSKVSSQLKRNGRTSDLIDNKKFVYSPANYMTLTGDDLRLILLVCFGKYSPSHYGKANLIALLHEEYAQEVKKWTTHEIRSFLTSKGVDTYDCKCKSRMCGIALELGF